MLRVGCYLRVLPAKSRESWKQGNCRVDKRKSAQQIQTRKGYKDILVHTKGNAICTFSLEKVS